MRTAPISAHNWRQRMHKLAAQARGFAWSIELWTMAASDGKNPFAKKRVTTAVRCINELARDLYRTNARPIKRTKK